MQKSFYRKNKGARASLFALWMLAAAILLNAPAAFAAPDPEMMRAPKGATSALIQKVSVVLSPDLGRPPLPAPKPDTRGDKTKIAKTSWDGGLQAYRVGNYELAFHFFARAETESPIQKDPWTHAAAAFWTARAAERLNDLESADGYRAIAARYEHTFYGQLARTQLGLSAHLSWEKPRPTSLDLARLKANPAGQAALTHIQEGRLSLADRALQTLAKGHNPQLRQAALTLALHHHLPATALKLAASVESETGIRYDAAYYPVGAWTADGDFRIDRALVHAIIRQESRFNPQARSAMGAVGLMQLLPSTANYIVKARAQGGSSARYDLTRSAHNLDVGQDYLEHLMDRPAVSGNLLNMLVAYNAGPGNLAKWQKKLNDVSDSLLFIETIPSAETRAYVEKVMAAYWIYSDQFGLDNPTLTQIAQGGTPSLTQAKTAKTWFSRLPWTSFSRTKGL